MNQQEDVHVIVMDDEAMIRGLIAKTLERHGYVVSQAGDGEEALGILREQLDAGVSAADCVLIFDLFVPTGLGGKAALERAREVVPDIKAIIASGYSDDGALMEMASHPFTAILSKPYDVRELLNSVADLLGAPDAAGT